ncbi:hypothetical protein RUM43_013675 [Polyplax serrata]|uniref:Uncharacterized protein n=1 Tax=Polyplax serrata TaxID=468196 RepID=A0AAN8NQG3_POLSC
MTRTKGEGKWSQLEPTGDRPPSLQEHTAVAYKDCIYVFGGEIGFSAGTETPLWIYNTKSNTWKKIRGRKGVLSPKGRRGHSALVYKGSMIIYGGYQDLRGSSNELWTYHFETESWHLILPKSSTVSVQRPNGRHKHSAVLHDGAMWIYGGMTDLQERGDLWRWDIASKMWCNIKTKSNPGPLHSHAVCKLPSSMLIFGGETNGLLLNDLWRFHFGTEVWEKLQFPGSKPHPRAESIALTVSELLFREESNIAGACSGIGYQRSSEMTRNNVCSSENSNNHSKTNKVGPVEKKYVFSECGKNYASGNLVTSAIQNNNLNFLKEISKLSSINLSRFNHKCSYSMLNSSSHDSTESLLKRKEGSDSAEQTPTRMPKSQSANVLANNEKRKTFSNLTPACAEKMPFPSLGESGEFSLIDSDHSGTCLLARDPVSVPNFNEYSAGPTTSATTDRLLSIDSDDSNYTKTSKLNNFNPNNLFNKRSCKETNEKTTIPGTPFANELKTLEPKAKNQDNYNFNKRCQSDSYSSHLVTLGNEEHVEKTDGIPKSASVVRFKKQPEIADEATSDYCSIETVNKVSSSSNYSQSSNEMHRELLNDYPELKFSRSTSSSSRKSNVKTGGNVKNTGYGFSNPHYMGPDVQTILKSNDAQKCAKVLNSPPDSVLEETGKVTKSNAGKENVEMTNMSTKKTNSNEYKVPKQVRSPPRYLPLRGNPYNTTTVPIEVDKKKKYRANSTGRPDKQEIFNRYLQQQYEEYSTVNMEPSVPLSIFLIGGKEHGQITVFKRPISLWKLRLSSNVY